MTGGEKKRKRRGPPHSRAGPKSNSFEEFLSNCEIQKHKHISLRRMKIGKNHIELLSNALESGRLDNIESMCFGSSISGLMPILAQGLSGHKGKLRRLKFDLTLLLNAYTDTKPLIEILQCQESNLEELEFHSCLDSVMARQVFKACATTSSHIKVLKMSLCDVNYTHGKVIRKVIESCTYLQHLDLSFNKLGNKGAPSSTVIWNSAMPWSRKPASCC